jgi:8-oxo-dGTP pyrophosphatase MutT (NUDIX family)
MALRKLECRQYGALPFHFDRHGAPHVYLVTSRGSGRWIIPKGNAIRGLAPHEIAAREAFEEAGLVGRVQQGRIGTFRFDRRRRGANKICLVDAYALAVEWQVPHWAEAGQRSVRRFDLATALSLVASPSLSTLIEHFMTCELRGRALGMHAGQVAA